MNKNILTKSKLHILKVLKDLIFETFKDFIFLLIAIYELYLLIFDNSNFNLLIFTIGLFRGQYVLQFLKIFIKENS